MEYYIVVNFGKRGKQAAKRCTGSYYLCKTNLQELFTSGEEGKGMLWRRVNCFFFLNDVKMAVLAFVTLEY